jgi:hypothetical protein
MWENGYQSRVYIYKDSKLLSPVYSIYYSLPREREQVESNTGFIRDIAFYTYPLQQFLRTVKDGLLLE